MLTRQDPEITNIKNLVDLHLQWKNLNGPPRGYEIYHPSAFGSCLRRMQYQRYAERGYIETKPESAAPNMIRIWDTGHNRGDAWAGYFADMGVLRGIWRCINPDCIYYDDNGVRHDVKQIDKPRVYGRDNKIGCFQPEKCCCGNCQFAYDEVTVVSEELNFRGHCDLILDFSRFDPSRYSEGNPVPFVMKLEDLPQEPIVVDMKTCNSFKFKRKLSSVPDFHYRVQVLIYTYLLDVPYGVLIYENKDNSETKIYQVPRNDEMWEKIKEQAHKMNAMVDKKLLPPPRPNAKTSTDCNYCEFSSICHSSRIWEDPKLHEKRSAFYGDFE